jgi:hypothetical protein
MSMEKIPVIPPGGCGGENKPAYELRHLIAALDGMNRQRAVGVIKAEPEDGRHWVRQVAGRPDVEGKEGIAHDRGSA